MTTRWASILQYIVSIWLGPETPTTSQLVGEHLLLQQQVFPGPDKDLGPEGKSREGTGRTSLFWSWWPVGPGFAFRGGLGQFWRRWCLPVATFSKAGASHGVQPALAIRLLSVLCLLSRVQHILRASIGIYGVLKGNPQPVVTLRNINFFTCLGNRVLPVRSSLPSRDHPRVRAPGLGLMG